MSAQTASVAAKRCFPPIIDERARVLILGTLPGEESLRLQQYYAHPRNHFWPVIADVAGASRPDTYDDRVAMLRRHRIALWDVLASAERSGSLDSAIRNGVANDFETLFSRFPDIGAIAFNGQGAQALYRRHALQSRATHILLPSTSPTNTKPLAKKIRAWRDALGPVLVD